MASAKRKPETESAQSLEEQLADAKATLSRLQALETETAAAAAAVYTGFSVAAEPESKASIRQAAELLLQGVNILDRPAPPRDRMLVLDERLAAIREAVRIALQRLSRLMLAREEEVAEEFMPIWRAHLAKVVAMVDGLRELAAERHALIMRWAERTGFRPQPIGCAEADEMLGLLDPFNRAYVMPDSPTGELLEAAKRARVR